MKEKLTRFLDKVLSLPPVYFYVVLGSICIGLFAISWFDREENPHSELKNQLENLAYEAQPDPASKITDLLSDLKTAAGARGERTSNLNMALKQLEKQVVKIVNGEAFLGHDSISPTFSGHGIDRESFSRRFSDDPIAVQRWSASENAPVIQGSEAFEKFVGNALGPWLKTTDFRIDLKVYSNGTAGGKVVANIVAEAYGRTSPNQGLQSTSIWKTTWLVQGESIALESIQIQAQEEVAAFVDGGQLLLDCTESIFQHCDTLKSQLGYGLDQWSRRVPNIDMVGNQGLAVGDINGDGLDDIYVCQPHGLPNCMLIQNPDGTVEDISKSSRLNILDESHGALMIDIDNDRDQDLVISTDENLLLMSNKGNGTFQLEHLLPIGKNAHSITAADYDQDGDLDLYLCKYQDLNRQSDLLVFPARLEAGEKMDGGRNVLLRNDEGWNFSDVTEDVGITKNNKSYSRSAAWHDYDSDGDQDLYVANEFSADQLFENQDGWFADISEKVGLNISARHRSVSVGEFNQDGKLDLFVATDVPMSAYRTIENTLTDVEGISDVRSLANVLTGESQIWFNGGAGQKFKPFFLRAPIFSSESAFASATSDLNNDGLDDVIVTNGFVSRLGEDVDELFYSSVFAPSSSNEKLGLSEDDTLSHKVARSVHMMSDLCREGYSFSALKRNRCYLSIGQMGFANMSAISGIDLPDDARGVAITDWDGDGDQDVVMTCRSAPQIRILCNQLNSKNQFVHFDLKGTDSNLDAIGAKVELYLSGKDVPLVKTLSAGSGNLSQSSKRVMFGVGKTEAIDRAVVVWPNGNSQTFENIQPNRRYEVTENLNLVAEKTSERFKLVIQPRLYDGSVSLPNVSERTLFYPRPPLPKFQIQSELNKWRSIEPIDELPTLMVFCARSANTEKFLKDVAESETRFLSKEMACVAVFVDEESDDFEHEMEHATRIAEEAKFPFRYGTAPASTIDKLKYLSGEWFNSHQLPSLPCAVLIDGQGRAAGFYSGEALTTNRVFQDFDFVTQPDWQYRVAATPLGGRWAARYRHAKVNRLRTRLKEVGYENDAKRLFEMSKNQVALELCQKAIELGAQGKTDLSRSYFQRSIAMDPNCVSAYIGEGNLLRKQAKVVKSKDDELSANLQLAAAANFEFAIGLDALNAEAIIGRANVAIDQNRIDDALQQLTEYVQVDPTRYEVHAIIGRLLFYQKKHNEAAKFMVTAFENRPSLPFVAGDLGFLYLGAGEYKQAEKFLRLAHRLQPSDKNILRLLAEAEFVTGRFDEAVPLFQKVTKSDPNRRRSKNLLAWLLATCPYENHRDGDEAMKIIDPLVQLFGDKSPATLEIYAACFAENSQFEEALKFQEQAIALVNSDQSTDTYSDSQKQGLKSRLELYRRKRPYRTADITQIPIQPPGIRR